MQLTQRKVGFIGVDVGSSALKVAQVEKTRQGWELAASAIVPRQQVVPTNSVDNPDAVSSRDELAAAKSLQDGYRGRKVAAALPMSLCDVHRVERDLSREPNFQNIIRQTVEVAIQASSASLQCDFWSAPARESKPAWSQILTAPRDWTEQICEDIAQVGWNCEAIDGPPLAMARAINMVHPPTRDEAVAGLDWGTGDATLCLVEEGQPSYVRTLKLCGLDQLLDKLSDSLLINQIEAQRLLEDYGLANNLAGKSSDISRLVNELASEYLTCLVDELERSFSHFQYVRRMPRPKHLYLLGGGAMIRGLNDELQARLKIETKPWQLPSSEAREDAESARAECLLATAIALSALAWEQS